MRCIAILIAIAFGTTGLAQGWTEPARSTETRSALMDAMRPHAEWYFGGVIEFMVRDLRVSGDRGFACCRRNVLVVRRSI